MATPRLNPKSTPHTAAKRTVWVGSAALAVLFSACKTQEPDAPFAATYSLSAAPSATGWESTPDSSAAPLALKEVSGGVPARDFPSCFWALEDGGNPAALYLVDFATGAVRAALNLPGANNTDWEDLASDGTFLYLADIGDNQAERGSVRIYRLPEPTSAQLSFTPGDTLNWTPSELQMRRFEYPDGPRDAESLVAVPFSDDVLIITKRDPEARVYSYSRSSAAAGEETLLFRGTLPHFYSTGAASWTSAGQDSAWLALRTYTGASVWTLKPGKDWTKSVLKTPRALPYPRREPQGETVFFWPNGDWTPLSEKAQGVSTPPYRFKRKS
jgi:hypothetical protein